MEGSMTAVALRRAVGIIRVSQHGMVVLAEPGEQFVSTAEDRADFETPNVRPVTTAPTPHPAAAPPTRPTPAPPAPRQVNAPGGTEPTEDELVEAYLGHAFPFLRSRWTPREREGERERAISH
jgi:hypothetical protein